MLLNRIATHWSRAVIVLGCIALIGVGQAGVELAKFLNDFVVGLIAVVVMWAAEFVRKMLHARR